MTTAAPKDPALNVGTISLNDCRTVCRALKLRAAELKKMGKKLRELDRPTEATSVAGEAEDIITRLGPKFDENGNFEFGPGPNEKVQRGKKGKGRDLFEMQARDRAEEERNRINRGGR